jgi:hypothetical protein
MKYVNYDKNTGKILGWYDDTVNGTYVPEVPAVLNADGTIKTEAIPAHYDMSNIPTPNLKVSEEQWQEAIDNNYNFVDVTNNTFGKKDFRTLDQIKQAKKQEINSAYEKAIQEPITYSVDGSDYVFQADKDSQDILAKVIVSAPSDFTTDWLDIDNNPVNVTLDDLKGLAQAILVRGQQLFTKKVQLKKQTDNVSTINEVESIKW